MQPASAGQAEPEAEARVLDQQSLMKLLPHRHPFLLIDQLRDIVAFHSATGIKAVSGMDPWMQGHFPGFPILPGVLMVEAMAQTAGALVLASFPGDSGEGKRVYFMSIEQARFRQPVLPGCLLEMPVELVKSRGDIWKARCECHVAGERVAEAKITAMIVSPGA